jgi:hypothetical protein
MFWIPDDHAIYLDIPCLYPEPGFSTRAETQL